MREESFRRYEYQHRLAQERARRSPSQKRWFGKFSAFTDYLGHKDLGEKTILFIIDGLYGNDNVDGPPHRKWKMAPFNDAWPKSIFMSFDGVAIDSVGFDFLTSEWPDLPDIANADNYLRESALANDPPSKTFYDPERDGIRCRSLGVHEHWNNGTARSTRAISEKRTGSSFPSLKCGTYLSRRCRGLVELINCR